MEHTANTVQRRHHFRIVRPYISAEAEQFASKYELGKASAEYRTHFSPLKMVYSSLCLALGLLLVVVMLMTEGISGQAIALVCALFFLVLGFIPLTNWLSRRSWQLIACADGFVFVRGKRVDVYRWEQIETVWQRVFKQYYRGLPVSATHKYRIQCSDGKHVAFDDTFANIEKFGVTVGREVTQNLLPAVLMAFNRGDAVSFGKIAVDSKGIHDGKELLAWSQVKGVTLSQDMVTFQQAGKVVTWSSAKVARIPNILVFMELADYAMGRQRFGASLSR